MAECYRCGVSDDKAQLFEAISKEGIVHVCRKCSFYDNLPMLRSGPEGVERKMSVYERLSRMAGIDRKRTAPKSDLVRKQETTLRELVDKNFEERVKKQTKKREDLIDNFHWAIMRTRRAKKLMQKQLADAISEPEKAIILAEQGVVPEDNVLIKKIENYLRIKLLKESGKKENPGILKFDSETTKALTIADLNKMEKREQPTKELKLSSKEENAEDDILSSGESEEQGTSEEKKEEKSSRKGFFKSIFRGED